ncbi:hypothetical protein GQ54DRAFT_267320, partial [Martensiomyces pterosporus]
DPNHINHLRFVVNNKLKVYPMEPQNIDELWNPVLEIWSSLTNEESTSSGESMHKHHTRVIAAKGVSKCIKVDWY